jgi:hypothetical protein
VSTVPSLYGIDWIRELVLTCDCVCFFSVLFLFFLFYYWFLLIASTLFFNVFLCD